MQRIGAFLGVAAVLALVGCGATAPKMQKASYPASQRQMIGYEKAVIPNRGGKVYMLVAPQGQRWTIEGVSSGMPRRSHARQEIIATNDDLHTWVFPLRSVLDYCPTNQTASVQEEYSLCNSALGKKSGLGNAILITGSAGTHPTRQYATNYQLAKAIVNSIPQAEVETWMQRLAQQAQEQAVRQRQLEEKLQQQHDQQQAAAREKQRLADQAYWNEVRAENKRQQAAFARRKVQEEKLIAEARKHPVGTEDRCLYKGELRAIGYGSEPLKCTFTTLDNTSLLAPSGWIIVNSQTNSYGDVVAYVIRKVR